MLKQLATPRMNAIFFKHLNITDRRLRNVLINHKTILAYKLLKKCYSFLIFLLKRIKIKKLDTCVYFFATLAKSRILIYLVFRGV